MISNKGVWELVMSPSLALRLTILPRTGEITRVFLSWASTNCRRLLAAASWAIAWALTSNRGPASSWAS